MIKRFIIATKDGKFIASINADRFELRKQANSFIGAIGGDFYLNGKIIGGTDDDVSFPVADSGGRPE